MSRRSQQFAKIAASGQMIQKDASDRTGTTWIRAGKGREDFEKTLPRGMKDEKRDRIVGRNYK